MTLQEYYEKFWKVDGQNPPPLTEQDKKLLRLWDMVKEGEIHVEDIHRLSNRRCGFTIMIKLQADYDKVPEFLKQPLNNTSNGENI